MIDVAYKTHSKMDNSMIQRIPKGLDQLKEFADLGILLYPQCSPYLLTIGSRNSSSIWLQQMLLTPSINLRESPASKRLMKEERKDERKKNVERGRVYNFYSTILRTYLDRILITRF